MINFRVVALDPGGTTGWAMYSQDGVTGEHSFSCGQIGPQEHHQQLYSFLESAHTHGTFEVACESFEFRQGKQRAGINLISKEYIGVTKLFGLDRDVPVVFATAGAAKGFVTNDKLKVMGLYHPGWKHAMDAYRHLIYWLVTKHRRYDLIESWKTLT